MCSLVSAVLIMKIKTEPNELAQSLRLKYWPLAVLVMPGGGFVQTSPLISDSGPKLKIHRADGTVWTGKYKTCGALFKSLHGRFGERRLVLIAHEPEIRFAACDTEEYVAFLNAPQFELSEAKVI